MIAYLFLVACCFATFFKMLFYAIIAICTFIIAYELYQYGKTIYVLKRIDDVCGIQIYRPIQKFKEVREKSGVSIGRYYTEHYRIKYVPYEKIWQARAYFKNGKYLNFEIRENSKEYDKIMCPK